MLPGSPKRGPYLSDLGDSLIDRYEQTKDKGDLEEAIRVYEQGVAEISSGSLARSGCLYRLGQGLKIRYTLTRNMNDKARAVALFEEACNRGKDLSPYLTQSIASAWGDWALERQDWDEAVRAYQYGIEASEHLFRVQPLRTNKEMSLRYSQQLYAHAAYAYARRGELHHAVETQEKGRARLLSQALERNQADLAQLEAQNPTVYKQYISAVNQLQVLEAQDISDSERAPLHYNLANAIAQTRSDLDEAVAAIRREPGFEEFLVSSSLKAIFFAAKETPLVYIAATPIGGMALVVSSNDRSKKKRNEIDTDSNPAITSLWLDNLTDAALSYMVWGWYDDVRLRRYLSYIGSYEHWRREPKDHEARNAWLIIMEQITRWLWGVLMESLVKFLVSTQYQQCILIPQGLLGLLPLHAAWTQDDDTPTGRRYALDEIAFSYAPNARVIATSQPMMLRNAPNDLLAVDEPYPVNAPRLEYSNMEVEAISSYFGSPLILHGEEATRSKLLTTVESNLLPPIWHLSCHGTGHPARPLESGLLLAHDEWLTLRDLLNLRLPEDVRLAVLSACEVGVPDKNLPDEVINLPTGLLQAGVVSVVATLWAVNELSTALLLLRFYELWRSKGVAPVEALRQAQIWVRDTTNKQKAEYIKAFLPEFASNRVPIATAKHLHRQLLLRRLHEHDFAHPYYWAAFGFTGVLRY
jgi:CHAT domain-containing protein